MKIKFATAKDAEDISTLILSVAATQLRDEFSDDGWTLFLELMSVKTQIGLIKNKKFFYLLAINSNDETVGVLAIKERSHLFHFFVLPAYQGHGVGKLLWSEYLADISQPTFNYRSPVKKFTEITVNSSDFGLEFYKSLGFIMSNGRQKKNGVCYTPMTYRLSNCEANQ